MRIHRGAGTEGRALIALHDLGHPEAGAFWRDLLDVWPGPAIAPDLRGHGGTDVPDGGSYAPSDFALDAVAALDRAGLAPAGAALPEGAWRSRRSGRPVPVPAADPSTWPVAAGHGWGGWAAELVAAAGRASALILLDGLGGPWATPEEIHSSRVAWMRAVAEDPEALTVPATRPDPILRHGFPTVWDQTFIEGIRARMTVPVLALESPASPTPADEREQRVAAFGGPAVLEEVAEPSAAAVLDALHRHPVG